jgi:glucose-1-phosphate cytidylyltransferase
MKVVILAGGQGTRLREETEFRPKPMVEIGGKPILWHLMKSFTSFQINEFILCLGFKGEMIREYFINYQLMQNDITVDIGKISGVKVDSEYAMENWKVTLADTGPLTPTGGRIFKIRNYIEEDS